MEDPVVWEWEWMVEISEHLLPVIWSFVNGDSPDLDVPYYQTYLTYFCLQKPAYLYLKV